MAKAPVKTKQQAPKSTSTAVATRGKVDASLPAHLRDYQSTGAGVPTDQSDFLIPMARVLDAKSPEVEKRGANYVQGAEPGDIYIKNSPIPIIKGDVGFLFQCCYIDKAVIEWLPRGKGGGGGGGFVARHPDDYISSSGNAEQKPHPEDKTKLIWVNKKSGNPLVETRYYGGFMISDDEDIPPMPLVLPFASTGHTVAKGWNMLMAQKRIGGKKADLWLVYYKITTRIKERNQQSWYLFDVADAGEDGATLWAPTIEDVERGRTLYEQLASGAKQFAQETSNTSDDNGAM